MTIKETIFIVSLVWMCMTNFSIADMSKSYSNKWTENICRLQILNIIIRIMEIFGWGRILPLKNKICIYYQKSVWYFINTLNAKKTQSLYSTEVYISYMYSANITLSNDTLQAMVTNKWQTVVMVSQLLFSLSQLLLI